MKDIHQGLLADELGTSSTGRIQLHDMTTNNAENYTQLLY